MAGRIRTIKPEILEDERTAHLSHAAWRLFVSLILVADDYGNFRANPDQLRGTVFWGRSVDVDGGVDPLLAELARLDPDGGDGLVTLYAVRGQRYGHLNGWTKNQRVDKPGSPRVPSPKDAESVELFANSREPPEPVACGSGSVPESRANGSGTIPVVLAPDLRSRSPINDPDHDQRPRGELLKEPRKRGRAPRSLIPANWRPSTELLDDLRRKYGVEPEPAVSRMVAWYRKEGRLLADFEQAYRLWVDRDAADGKLEPWAPPDYQLPPGPVKVEDPVALEAAKRAAVKAAQELADKQERESIKNIEVGENAPIWKAGGP